MFAGGQLEWVVTFSVNGDDPSKWYALTNLDRIVPIIGFYDDEGDPVDDVDDAFLLVAGEERPEFQICLQGWQVRSNS